MDLLYACREANLEESTLLLAEHIFTQKPSPETFFILLQGLMSSSKYEAVKWLTNRRKEYFKYGDIQRIYIEALKRLGEISEVEQFQISSSTLSYSPVKNIKISSDSLNSYYQALIQKGSEEKRTAALSAAIEYDERNLEAYIYIGTNRSQAELAECIDKISCDSTRSLFSKILTGPSESFSLFSRSFYSPFSCCCIARRLFNDKQTSEIFQAAQYMAAVYPGHYFTYVIGGMYYILVGKYADAKRSLYKALQLNSSFATGWILLGYCQAFLCEGVSAISCYEKAEVLTGDAVPSLGIALEYHRMRSHKKAEKKYEEIQNKYGLEYCFVPYVSLLIVQQRYEEALSLVHSTAYTGEKGLLKSICCLFIGDYAGAESALANVNISYHQEMRSKYFLLLGYVRHVNRNYCEAIELYQKAILDPSKPIGTLVNDLLELAIKNSLEEDEKCLVVQYKEDVFEYLDFKSTLELNV